MRVFLMAARQQALKYPTGGRVLSQAGRVAVAQSCARRWSCFLTTSNAPAARELIDLGRLIDRSMAGAIAGNWRS
ncbi:hypothetical protein CEJ42_17590 [Herbaspirillum robiniae]|uniref:Uncharacterized protein n=1 Tax=Herbaspirillum robiniae TaxID=2014887 RepID=A0A246WNF6_9BURK|nr:hypothetical protein CEJ42_17590 [Herbaspirillum robiniae]